MAVGSKPTRAIDGTLGVRLTDTIATTADKAFDLGHTVKCDGNSVFMYTRALSTVAQYDVLSLTVDSTVAPLTLDNASANGKAVAFAQTAIASGSFGWVALSGNKIRCLINKDSALGAPLRQEHQELAS